MDFSTYQTEVDKLQKAITAAQDLGQVLELKRQLALTAYEYQVTMANGAVAHSRSQKSHQDDIVLYMNRVLDATDAILDYAEGNYKDPSETGINVTEYLDRCSYLEYRARKERNQKKQQETAGTTRPNVNISENLQEAADFQWAARTKFFK